MDLSLLSGVLLFAAVLPGPSVPNNFPERVAAANGRMVFTAAHADTWSAIRAWEAGTGDPVYKPLAELRRQLSWCKYGQEAWDCVEFARGSYSDTDRALALGQLWVLIGPANYAAGQLPRPPRLNRHGYYVFE